MATKSILKNIEINDKKRCKSLIIALERAAEIPSKNVQLSRPYEEAQGEKIRSILNK